MRVLLATDGSVDARKATTWLHELPLPPASIVRVLGVAPTPHGALDIAPVREVHEWVRAEMWKEAEAARTRLSDRSLTEARIVDGEPREMIVGEAAGWPADLVVVGARGLGAVGRFLLGSVSTAVLHEAPRAVAVVHGTPCAPRRVLVATDGSPDAEAAVTFVGQLPFGRETTVHLLGVATPPPIPAGPDVAVPWPPALDRFIDDQKDDLAGVLARTAAALARTVGRVERSIVVGQPAAEIVAAAERGRVDLVVVGARGLGMFGRLVLGSVSDRVVHHAPCPVIVVKAKA